MSTDVMIGVKNEMQQEAASLYDQSFPGPWRLRTKLCNRSDPDEQEWHPWALLPRHKFHSQTEGLRRTWRRVDAYFKVFANVGLSIQMLPCVSHPVCVFVSVSLGVLDNYQLHSSDLLGFVESR